MVHYRAEIDGLRAVAVIPVMLFHAGFTLFGGGFVGVDVFFVISGYLITTIILNDLERDNFSIVSFYERRARRILPALFLVVAVCTPFAVAWLTHRDLRDYAQSVIAVSTFSSNILFWIESGYFDTAAETKPLLHTWSLAVEEQFYILFPVVMILGWRLRRRKLIYVLVAAFLVSLAAAHVLPIVWTDPKVASGAFYLAPTRAWELLLGSFAAFYLNAYGKTSLSNRANDFLAMLGVALIMTAIFIFDQSTPFPGLYALVPTVGTLLIILCAVEGTFTARILSVRALVFMGLISYSAYLWHQPLFAFAKYRSLNHPTAAMMSVLLVVSVMLAFLSWKYVEVPFRKRTLMSRAFVFKASAATAACLVVLGLSMGQQSAPVDYAGDGLRGNEGVLSSDTRIVLYGDSHARQYYKSLTEDYKNVKMITGAGCMSLPGIVNLSNRERRKCLDRIDELREAMSGDNADLTLVLAYRWTKDLFDLSSRQPLGMATEPDALPHLLDALEKISEEISQGKRIIIIGNVPAAHVAGEFMREGYERCRSFLNSDCPASYPIDLGEAKQFNAALAEFAAEHDNVVFVDPRDALCDKETCFVVSDGDLLYSDHSHLTTRGARMVVDRLTETAAMDLTETGS